VLGTQMPALEDNHDPPKAALQLDVPRMGLRIEGRRTLSMSAT